MFKRNEDVYLERAKQHIEKTYSGHYVNDNNIQAADLWEAQGSLLTTARDTAEKYLMRFGKKEGENLEDLYKAIHFILMMIHVVEKGRQRKSYDIPQTYNVVVKGFPQDNFFVTNYANLRKDDYQNKLIEDVENLLKTYKGKRTEYPHYGFGTPDYVAETAKELLEKNDKVKQK